VDNQQCAVTSVTDKTLEDPCRKTLHNAENIKVDLASDKPLKPTAIRDSSNAV